MKMNIALIVVGLALAAVGVVRIISDRKAPTHEISESVQEPEDKKEIMSEADAQQPDNKEKGNAFEAYIADILKENGILIKQWNQGAVTESGAHAEDIYNPDFFVTQANGNHNIEYWVECKFRSKIPASGFELDAAQVERYRRAQGKSRRKVIIALGLGGAAASPERMFLIPLDSLARFKHIPEKYLGHYQLLQPGEDFAGHMKDWFCNEVFQNTNK